MSPLTRPNRLPALLAAASIVLAGFVAVGAAWYAGWSARHLPAMAEGLGEVWMDRAGRAEAAGDLETALDYYERALAGRFHGAQNRNHCQKHLGVVLYRLGRYEEALPHLEEAQAGVHRSINGYKPLIDTYMALQHWEEAEAAALTWLEAWPEDALLGDLPHLALAQIAMTKGDLTEARAWLDNTVVTIVRRGAARKAILARLLALEGDFAAACKEMEMHLQSAPPNDESVRDWSLLETWEQVSGNTDSL